MPEVEMDIDGLIEFCNGKRVRIIYSVHIPALAFLFHHYLPHFIRKEKEIVFLLYSEGLARKLEVEYQAFFEKMDPEKQKIKDALDNARIIKVGSNEKIPFGKLGDYIQLTDLDTIMDELTTKLSNFDGNVLLVIYGLHLVSAVYGSKGVERILKLFDVLEDDLTMVSMVPSEIYPTSHHVLFQELYDIVIKISTEEEFVAFGEDTFLVGIVQSFTPKIPIGYMRVRVIPELRLERIGTLVRS
ncbi:hypothetical protein [Archaeoglobus veneficus]|nr:hypothetical protein [Archaeoglobus veneficus]